MKYPKVHWDRTSSAAGYEATYCPDHPKAWYTGYVHTHRIVMELMLGRFLEFGEVVHHKDENKRNNSPSNLELTTKSKHAKHHAKRVTKPLCKRCGVPLPRRGRTFCSRRCNALNTQAQGKWLGYQRKD